MKLKENIPTWLTNAREIILANGVMPQKELVQFKKNKNAVHPDEHDMFHITIYDDRADKFFAKKFVPEEKLLSALPVSIRNLSVFWRVQ